MMEPEFATAEKIKLRKIEDKDFYMPLYQSTMYGDQWMQGILWPTKKEAIEAHRYDENLTKFTIFKITLPVENVRKNVSV